MKKLISITSIIVISQCVYSCGEAEEITGNPNMENLDKKQKTDSSHIQTEDSLKAGGDNETKDPPIKDGQDWKILRKK